MLIMNGDTPTWLSPKTSAPRCVVLVGGPYSPITSTLE